MRASLWDLILSQAPTLIDLATQVATTSRDRTADIAAANDSRAVREQLAELATDQQAHAALLGEITAQLDAMAKASRAAADRATQALVAGGIAILLGLAALVVALSR
jgi:hypothetical protein